MKNKKCYLIIGILALAIIIFIFCKMNYKVRENGNNISNKSIEEIEEYILNINEYETEAEIEIQSNKNSNKYKIYQKVKDNVMEQEIKEPKNIEGVKIKYENGNLQITNEQLGLTTLYEKYNNITNNNLWLTSFIKEYKDMQESNIKYENDKIVLEVKDSSSKYNSYKKLYCNNKTMQPEKLEIRDENQNLRIYISYKEMKISNNRDIVAFKIKNLYYGEY